MTPSQGGFCTNWRISHYGSLSKFIEKIPNVELVVKALWLKTENGKSEELEYCNLIAFFSFLLLCYY